MNLDRSPQILGTVAVLGVLAGLALSLAYLFTPREAAPSTPLLEIEQQESAGLGSATTEAQRETQTKRSEQRRALDETDPSDVEPAPSLHFRVRSPEGTLVHWAEIEGREQDSQHGWRLQGTTGTRGFVRPPYKQAMELRAVTPRFQSPVVELAAGRAGEYEFPLQEEITHEPGASVSGRLLPGEMDLSRIRVRMARFHSDESDPYEETDGLAPDADERFDTLDWPESEAWKRRWPLVLDEHGRFWTAMQLEDGGVGTWWRIEVWWASKWSEQPMDGRTEHAIPLLATPAFPLAPREHHHHPDIVLTPPPSVRATLDRNSLPQEADPLAISWTLRMHRSGRDARHLFSPYIDLFEGLWPQEGPWELSLPHGLLGARLELRAHYQAQSVTVESDGLRAGLNDLGVLAFAPPARLSGVVWSRISAGPVPRLCVELRAHANEPSFLKPPDYFATTDELGRFEFDRMGPGHYEFGIRFAQDLPLLGRRPDYVESLELEAGEDRSLRVELDERFTEIDGRLEGMPDSWRGWIRITQSDDVGLRIQPLNGDRFHCLARSTGLLKLEAVGNTDPSEPFVLATAEWSPQPVTRTQLVLRPRDSRITLQAPADSGTATAQVEPIDDRARDGGFGRELTIELPPDGSARELIGLRAGKYKIRIRARESGALLREWEVEVD